MRRGRRKARAEIVDEILRVSRHMAEEHFYTPQHPEGDGQAAWFVRNSDMSRLRFLHGALERLR